jgi:hypothetical protein
MPAATTRKTLTHADGQNAGAKHVPTLSLAALIDCQQSWTLPS